MTDITTLLLVDGDPGSIRGLRMRLALEPDLQVVGEASWDDDVTTTARALAPAVVVADVDTAGAAAAERVRALAAGHAVVVLSVRDDRATAAAMRASGAGAFVAKHDGVRRLLEAIRDCTGSRNGCGP